MNQSPRLLIADDSPTVTSILGFLFTEEGYQTETASDGVETIEKFYKNPPDLVVLDIEMPRMNGYQVCRILKDDPQTNKVPIIVLTSRDLQSDRFRGLSVGADAYIVKNLEDDQLIVTVRDLVKFSPWKDTTRPASRGLREGEILERVNRMLDRRLFESNVVTQLQEINSSVDSFELAVKEVIGLFSKIFEFVIGGVMLTTCRPQKAYFAMLEGFENEFAGDFLKFLIDYGRSEIGVEIHKEPLLEVFPHRGKSTRIFPKSNELTDRLAWSLTSRGQVIGIIGMAATAPLKFDKEGTEILESFNNYASVILDNTTLVKKQAETNVELSRTLDELKSTQAQLIQSEKLASLGQLMAGLVHEMNNPLNFILGNMEHINTYTTRMLKLVERYTEHFSSDIPDSIKELESEIDIDFIRDDLPLILSDCREGVNRAQHIITDLRTFSSQDRDEMTEADLRAVIESTINILRHEWEPVADIIREFDESFMVKCNENQIGQVIMNLFTNAIHAVTDTGRRGEIRIILKNMNDYVIVEIADNGVGISQVNLSNLFQPFFTTRDIGKGMGLGLSITHGIIKRHGGEIEVKSELGKGTRFIIRLPKLITNYESQITNKVLIPKS